MKTSTLENILLSVKEYAALLCKKHGLSVVRTCTEEDGALNINLRFTELDADGKPVIGASKHAKANSYADSIGISRDGNLIGSYFVDSSVIYKIVDFDTKARKYKLLVKTAASEILLSEKTYRVSGLLIKARTCTKSFREAYAKITGSLKKPPLMPTLEQFKQWLKGPFKESATEKFLALQEETEIIKRFKSLITVHGNVTDEQAECIYRFVKVTDFVSAFNYYCKYKKLD